MIITIADAVFRAFGQASPSGPLGNEFYQQAAKQTDWMECFQKNLPGGVEDDVIIVALSIVARVLEYRWPLSQKETSCVESIRKLINDSDSSGLSGRLLLRAVVAGRSEERPFPDPPPWGEMGWETSDPLLNEYWAPRRLEATVNTAVTARRQGAHYRILFPTVLMSREQKMGKAVLTVENKTGRLVWAEVTVCPPLNGNHPREARLVLAPWTFFLPEEEGERSWGDLCDAFPKALSHLRPCPTEPRDYLVSLHPVGPEDLPWGTTRQRFDTAPELAPHGVKIGGPSLGVAVALAAHAAAMNRRVRPIIATGKIQGNGDVLKVAGTAQKLRAWNLFQRGSEATEPPLFLYPDKNELEVRTEAEDLRLDDARQSRLLCPLKSLADLEPDPKTLRDFFTDGFDGYRAWLKKLSSPATPNEETAEMFQALQSVLTALSSPPPKDTRLHQPSAWFDEEPHQLADDLFRRLAKDWGDFLGRQTGQDYNAPVVVCVSVDNLLTERGWPDDLLLPGRLARTVQARCRDSWPGGAGSLPSAEDFAAALRRPGKLILIVSDLPSLKVWPLIDENRSRLMRCLKNLAAPAPNQGVKPQHVVLVFSDLHHQMWFEKGCPSVTTTAAAM